MSFYLWRQGYRQFFVRALSLSTLFVSAVPALLKQTNQTHNSHKLYDVCNLYPHKILKGREYENRFS